MKNSATITIVGGGSCAHILVSLLSQSGHTVNLLTRKPNHWSRNIETQVQSCRDEFKQTIHGSINLISNRPEEVIPQANVIIFCMPVCQYRTALHHIAPYITNSEEVFVGTVYGQSGFNWMAGEVQKKFSLDKITIFAIGHLPWICRAPEYGKKAVIYGNPRGVNVVAMSAHERFPYLNDLFLNDIYQKWFGTGDFVLADSFLSITLTLDNQIIHPSRCYGLYQKYGGKWSTKEEIPYFYRDFDQLSAQTLQDLDADYSLIRDAIRAKYPEKNFWYMMDYLALERLSYQLERRDICESFTKSKALREIKPPTVQDQNGDWVIDTNHRFFTDDIHYGLCIAKWIAEKLDLTVPTIDRIIRWAQEIRHEEIIDDDNNLLPMKSNQSQNNFLSGVPTEYGFNSIDDIVD